MARNLSQAAHNLAGMAANMLWMAHNLAGIVCNLKELAGGLGFEPRFLESKSNVLPLDDPPVSPRQYTERGFRVDL